MFRRGEENPLADIVKLSLDVAGGWGAGVRTDD